MLDYATVRSSIPDGAIMLSAGRGLAASIIRFWTKSQYSHCGQLFWIGMNREHLMLVEAVDQGVQVIRFSNYLERAKKERRMVSYAVHAEVTTHKADLMKNHAIYLSGKPYDYMGLLVAGADIVIDLPGESDKLPKVDKYICSRLVLECMFAGGVQLDHRYGYITPDGIAKQVNVAGRLV